MANINKSYDITTLKGLKFTLSQTCNLEEGKYPYIKYSILDTRASLTTANNQKALEIKATLEICKKIKKEWGITAKPGNIFLAISEENWKMLKDSEAEIKRPYTEAQERKKKALEAEIDAMPKFLCYQSGLDWGDNVINPISQIVVVRQYTETEKVNINPEYLDHYLVHEILLNNCTVPSNLGFALQKFEVKIPSGYDLFLISEEQYAALRKDTYDALEARRLDEIKKAQEKEQKEKKAEEKRAAEYKNALENELFIWDSDQIYSSATNLFLHSIGLKLSKNKNRIAFYTTTYAKQIEKYMSVNTTYSMKDELKALGYEFDDSEKEWYTEYSPENAEKAVELLKKYDTKAQPNQLNMGRCWECGTYHPISKMKIDGPGYYCGC